RPYPLLGEGSVAVSGRWVSNARSAGPIRALAQRQQAQRRKSAAATPGNKIFYCSSLLTILLSRVGQTLVCQYHELAPDRLTSVPFFLFRFRRGNQIRRPVNIMHISVKLAKSFLQWPDHKEKPQGRAIAINRAGSASNNVKNPGSSRQSCE